jgi:hypothetical protein
MTHSKIIILTLTLLSPMVMADCPKACLYQKDAKVETIEAYIRAKILDENIGAVGIISTLNEFQECLDACPKKGRKE